MTYLRAAASPNLYQQPPKLTLFLVCLSLIESLESGLAFLDLSKLTQRRGQQVVYRGLVGITDGRPADSGHSVSVTSLFQQNFAGEELRAPSGSGLFLTAL